MQEQQALTEAVARWGKTADVWVSPIDNMCMVAQNYAKGIVGRGKTWEEAFRDAEKQKADKQ